MRQEDMEAMAEILEEYGVKLPAVITNKITFNFLEHVSAMSVMEHTSNIGGSSECSKCKELKTEIDRLNRDIGVYQESVKKRRGATHAYIENGSVKYDLA